MKQLISYINRWKTAKTEKTLKRYTVLIIHLMNSIKVYDLLENKTLRQEHIDTLYDVKRLEKIRCTTKYTDVIRQRKSMT